MWSFIALCIQKVIKKNALDTQLKKDPNGAGKSVKKLYRQNSILTRAIVLTALVQLGLFIGIVMVIVYSMMTFASTSSYRILMNKIEAAKQEEEEGWMWEVAQQAQNPSQQNPNGLTGSGGIYPKDPKLKQLAKLVEILDKSKDTSNEKAKAKLGAAYTPRVTGFGVIANLIRESSGVLFNEVMKDPSLDILTQLKYPNPICNKGRNCSFVNNGISHFYKLGSNKDHAGVSGGKDNGDPATMTPIPEYRVGPNDHALSYAQFEVISLGSEFVTAYKSGDFENKDYDNKKDRFKMDNTLKFIRPNLGYIPDLINNVTNHLCFNLSPGGAQSENEIKKEPWYDTLSDDEKAFCHELQGQFSYLGGYVKYKYAQMMSGLIVVANGLKQDGHIEKLQDIAKFLCKTYGGTRYSNFVDKLFDDKTYRFSYNGHLATTEMINAVMSSGTSLGPNTAAAIRRATSVYGTPTSFNYYGTGSAATWERGIPHLFILESAASDVRKRIDDILANAEKEDVQAGQAGSGANSALGTGTGAGVRGSNNLEYIGSGLFANPTGNTEHYYDYPNEHVQAIWFAQSSRKSFGGSTTIASYDAALRNRKYINNIMTYGGVGCPTYSWAMLLSNISGTVVLPDVLPFSTEGNSVFPGGGRLIGPTSTGVTGSGWGHGAAEPSIRLFNKYLKDNGYGFELRCKELSKKQLNSLDDDYLYKWLDHGALLWTRILNYNGAPRHSIVIAGYNKNDQVGNWYGLRLLNSICGDNYKITKDQYTGQYCSATTLKNNNGLSGLTGNFDNDGPVVLVWRTDLAPNGLPGLSGI